MKKRLLEWLFINVLRARWIVSEEENAEGELGLRILGVNLFYYKWPDPMLAGYKWRFAEKREFGEVIRSRVVASRSKN